MTYTDKAIAISLIAAFLEFIVCWVIANTEELSDNKI